MNETFIHLDLLDPNPYQPRQHEDSAVVQELAENILRTATVDFDGLLQAPTVRAIGGDRYQKYLQELATTWGVKLPKDFLTKAAEHDEAVKLEIAELDKPDKDGAE